MTLRAILSLALCSLAPEPLTAAELQADIPRIFQARVDPLAPTERRAMIGHSWTEGCPVPLDDLMAIRLNHWGYDDTVRQGVLVVHRKVSGEVVEAFRTLFDAGFPIERIQPYETYGIGEYAASNATVGFYCRPAQDSPSVFSWHAYGLAIDLNPMTNPYRDPKGWWPAGSDTNSSRNQVMPGLIAPRSAPVAAFLAQGWAWGGTHTASPDYMHFGKVTLGDEPNPLNRNIWVDRLRYTPD
ncbi:M15 family metallopeptidase [Roseomonas sp. 18066]|uniref:M15 family metallopeptidase n=1 Tax=Roseomonas sp. 18066 TaxID=2681412 RepID=UPI00135B4A21|nr:M15 family metallopeptidase [Roseomonas sp. 18066]